MNTIVNDNFKGFSPETFKFLLELEFNCEIYGIIALSLVVTIISTVLSAVLAIPSGIVIGSSEFTGKRLLTRLISTFMGLPLWSQDLSFICCYPERGH